MNQKLLISLLVYNQLELTRKCLEALLRHTTGEYLIHVWDNASRKDTWDYFKTFNHSRMVYHRSDQNIGFIPSHNAVFEKYRNEFPYFCVLNNDLILEEPGWNQKLINYLENNNLAVVGPKQVYQLDDRMWGVKRIKAQLDYIEGSLLLVKTSVINNNLASLFDGKYLNFIFFEDSDLCLRLKAKGYQIGEVDIKYTHLHNQTISREKIRAPIKTHLEHNAVIAKDRWSVFHSQNRKMRVLVKRGYALGDVLCTEPVLRALPQKYPHSEISVETTCGGVLKYCGLPLVEVGPGLHQRSPANWDRVIDLKSAYEKRPHLHMVRAYADEAGVVLDDPVPTYDPNLRWSGNKSWRIIASAQGSWPTRTWDLNKWRNVFAEIKADGNEILEVGTDPGRFTGVGANMIGAFPGNEGIHKMAELIVGADMYIGIDGFLMHLAQAVGTPVLAVFGCIYPGYRIHDWSKAKAVWLDQNQLKCAGCHHFLPSPREHTGCDKILCLKNMTEQMVLDAYYNQPYGMKPPLHLREWRKP